MWRLLPAKRSSRFILVRVLVMAILASTAGVIAPHPASASCAEPPDLETAFADSGVVFIGLVVNLSNNNRTAVMEVEEVWKGASLPDVVTVNGGPADEGSFTSVDRTFEAGTYIVFPVNTKPPFEDNACTLTQRTSTALDVINPFLDELDGGTGTAGTLITTVASEEPPTSTTAESSATAEAVLASGGNNAVPMLAVIAAVAALGIGVLAWRRRSSSGT